MYVGVLEFCQWARQKRKSQSRRPCRLCECSRKPARDRSCFHSPNRATPPRRLTSPPSIMAKRQQQQQQQHALDSASSSDDDNLFQPTFASTQTVSSSKIHKKRQRKKNKPNPPNADADTAAVARLDRRSTNQDQDPKRVQETGV